MARSIYAFRGAGWSWEMIICELIRADGWIVRLWLSGQPIDFRVATKAIGLDLIEYLLATFPNMVLQ